MASGLRSHDRHDLFAVLASGPCRDVLSELRTREDDVTSLTALAGGESASDSQGVATPAYLHHVTLPKLDDAGLVDYDPVEHTVRYRASEQVESLLTAVEQG